MGNNYDKVLEYFDERISEAVDGEIPRVFYTAYDIDDQEIPIDNIDQICAQGNIRFFLFNNFTTRQYQDPTWLDLCVEIHRFSKRFNIPYLLFLESIKMKNDNLVKVNFFYRNIIKN